MMQRRHFLKLMATSGLVLTCPGLSNVSRAAVSSDRYWVMVNAGGGWDPTHLCDPKGDAPRSDGRGPVNNFAAADIRTVGNISYAPYASTITAPAVDIFDNFFQRHGSRMCVINGIDNQTNSHSVGSRSTWSGASDVGSPALAALIAASVPEGMPMAYISNGGYDFTDELVSASRVSGSSDFAKMAFPNQPRPGHDDRYFPDSIYALIEARQRASLDGVVSGSSLLRRREQARRLKEAREGTGSLNQIVSRLPSSMSGGLKGQGEMAAAAFASGLAVAANLNTGGFDTHGNHDNNHTNSMNTLLDGVDHLWDELVRQGIADRTTILIGSDFGRTPFYNSGNGKDHWNVTSLMAIGAGITGNRVVGGTTDLFEARKVNPTTLAFDDSGTTITPAHVHKALRRLAGISDTELDRRYSLMAEELPLFG